jgi:ubiquinone/menaquinone biosynthesis C-methylase UbiE
MSKTAAPSAPEVLSGSPERFGYEWATYFEIRPEYEEQFRRWAVHISPDDWRGKSFLDVGCGMGRNSYWPMTYGAAEGVAIDVDRRSLKAAKANLARFPAIKVEERSAYDIGHENAFDIAFSIGVIHHLEHPERALAGMVKAVKPGGKVLIWVYGLENNRWIVYLFNPLRKALFSRLPIGFVHHLSLYPTVLLWIGLRLGLGRIAYFDLLRRMTFRHVRSIVFDQMLPKIANYWPRTKVKGLLQEQGLTDVMLAWVNEMSWSAIGTRPDTAAAGKKVFPMRETSSGKIAIAHPSLACIIDLLRCPISAQPLLQDGDSLVSLDGKFRYPVTASGIPLFAKNIRSAEAAAQEAHYEKIAEDYVKNLGYPHTDEYMKFLDRILLDEVSQCRLETVLEICCGQGEVFKLLGHGVRRGVGVDISLSMLKAAQEEHTQHQISFVQGDATMLPLAGETFDSVFMLGGIHHVNDRSKLFGEIARVLKPGGAFYFREPVSDFFVWRQLRSVIYRLSPALDHETERPLTYEETAPVLKAAGLMCSTWKTHGFVGFCLFMNSDVLVFNRLFRFIPGIRSITRAAILLDEWMVSLPPFQHVGLQVIGVARKPKEDP